jgi:hypothetical protein
MERREEEERERERVREWEQGVVVVGEVCWCLGGSCQVAMSLQGKHTPQPPAHAAQLLLLANTHPLHFLMWLKSFASTD